MIDYTTLSAAVWIIFAGVCFGAFYAYYHRRLLGDLLRSFIAAGASDEQSAKTLDEAGYGSGIKQSFARFALKKGSVLRKTICTVYDEKAPVKKHSDQLFAKAPQDQREQRYYIPEERRITAEVRYDGKGTTATMLMVTVISFFVAAIIIVSLLPWIMRNYQNLINSVNGSNTEVPETQYEHQLPATDTQEQVKDEQPSDDSETTPESDNGASETDGGSIDYTLPQ